MLEMGQSAGNFFIKKNLRDFMPASY